MRRTNILPPILAALLLSLLVAGRSLVAADTASVPSLTISQLKITSSNGQFITLYNAGSAAIDMSKYQLEYFNNYDLAKASSSKLIALAGIVPPHGYFMVNDSSLALCYQMMVDSVSLGLSSTAGFIQVLGVSQPGSGGPVANSVQDYVGWSKTAVSGAQTLPANTSAFLQRLPLDAAGNPTVAAPGAGSWQTVLPDSNNPCALTTSSGAPLAAGPSQLLPSGQPPAALVAGTADGDEVAAGSLPPADIGLMVPQITELLPNPAGTGNDDTDEFIELYNPNGKEFDLSGFALQTGLKSFRKYVFPADTTLPSHSFTAFYSEATDLSLSNSGSQVKLLDPLGNAIAASNPYATAKDGQAWALDSSKWSWTTQPTPNAANVIKQPVSGKKKSAKSQPAKTKIAKTKTAKTHTQKISSATAAAKEPVTAPVHLGVLALIISGALLYGAYEYRTDLANKLYQFRRYFAARRASRP